MSAWAVGTGRRFERRAANGGKDWDGQTVSTKATIKSRAQTDTRPGFHLYDDVLDSFAAEAGEPEPPVYLRLSGVSVQLETLAAGGATVTVALPRELARELGLLPRASGVVEP